MSDERFKPQGATGRSTANIGRLTVSVVAAVAVALILLEAALHDGPADFWSVAVPGVLTGVGTLGLATVTAFMAISERAERRMLRNDRDEARNERDLERASSEELKREATRTAVEMERERLAQGVHCSMTRMAYDPGLFAHTEDQPARGADLPVAQIVNTSDRDISGVIVYWYKGSGGVPQNIAPVASGPVGSVPRQGIRAYQQPKDLRPLTQDELVVRIEFEDAQRVRWERWSNGDLTELSAS